MYGKISGILMPVLAVGLVGAGLWGYQENHEKNSVLIKAENQYQRAFHDLNSHVDNLQGELGKTIAVNSRNQLTPSLANVWRLAYTSQNDVGQLPLTLMPFNKTEEFLANVANFSYKTAVRDLDKTPLSQDEYKTLQVLYNQSKEIQRDLQKVQTSIIDHQLRWMDVEKALAMEKKQEDNTIIDGLKMVDKNVEGYNTTEFGTGIGMPNQNKSSKSLSIKGKAIGTEEAKQNAIRFSGLSSDKIKKVNVVPNGKGDRFQSFSIKIDKTTDKLPIDMDVSRNGGQVVWMLDERQLGKPAIDFPTAQKKAEEFLNSHGYKNMVAVSMAKYDGLAVYTYVYQQNGVRIYPDVVTVKVALDKGDVVGLQSETYLLKHKERNIPSPRIAANVAKKQVNPSLTVTDTHLAIVENDEESEVLTYEFIGKIDSGTYRIYIDASTGKEVKVEKVETPSI